MARGKQCHSAGIHVVAGPRLWWAQGVSGPRRARVARRGRPTSLRRGMGDGRRQHIGTRRPWDSLRGLSVGDRGRGAGEGTRGAAPSCGGVGSELLAAGHVLEDGVAEDAADEDGVEADADARMIRAGGARGGGLGSRLGGRVAGLFGGASAEERCWRRGPRVDQGGGGGGGAAPAASECRRGAGPASRAPRRCGRRPRRPPRRPGRPRPASPPRHR